MSELSGFVGHPVGVGALLGGVGNTTTPCNTQSGEERVKHNLYVLCGLSEQYYTRGYR